MAKPKKKAKKLPKHGNIPVVYFVDDLDHPNLAGDTVVYVPMWARDAYSYFKAVIWEEIAGHLIDLQSRLSGESAKDLERSIKYIASLRSDRLSDLTLDIPKQKE